MFDVAPAVEKEIQVLRYALDELQQTALRAGSTRKMEPAAFRALLGEQLENAQLSAGFIAGGVTFCAMLPMRSIPFRVICLLGMNSGEFPRDDRRPGFDLIAGDPRPGDRSRRNDDKYLFLEALISARDTFYISYVGQSERDNADLPPSVLVSELIDYLRQGYGDESEALVMRHRLHPFSPDYYRPGSPFFSYDQDNFRAGESIAVTGAPAPFFVSELAWPLDTGWKKLDVEALCRFFGNPSRYFLQQRLGVTMRRPEAPLPDRENFSLSGLDRYRLEQKILAAKHNGVPDDRLMGICRETGLLPHGVVGDIAFFRAEIEASKFLEKIQAVQFPGTPDAIEIDDVFGDFRLQGRIDRVFEEGLLALRYAKQRPIDLLSAWIRHLALCCHFGGDRQFHSVLCCKDRYCRFRHPENAREIMESLIACYRSGICSPLMFFPRAAMAYMKQMGKMPPVETAARHAARKVWEGNDYQPGESQDPDFQRCFDSWHPIDDRFADVSKQVYAPMMKHMEDRKWG